MFYNELELLEIRLDELKDAADRFVIVEAARTFTNQPKPLYFNENREMFSEFLDRIEYVLIENFDGCNSAWECELVQRNAIIKALKNCTDDDIIVISDADEIPNAKTLLKCKDLPGVKVLEQKQYNFFLNYINSSEKYWLRGPRVLSYKDFKNSNKTANEIRNINGKIIKNGGWHFSFLGGIEKVKTKIRAFSHQEYNTKYYNDSKRLSEMIYAGKDIFERGYRYEIAKIDKSFPLYLQKNKERFAELILKKENPLKTLVKRLAKPVLSLCKKLFWKKIETYKSISDGIGDEYLDFISFGAKKILEIGSNAEMLKKHFSAEIVELIPDGHLAENISLLEDNSVDCVVFSDSFSQIAQIDSVLENLKPKMSSNGYIVCTIPNFRHYKILNMIFTKKQFKYEKNDYGNEIYGVMQKSSLRFYTRKSILDLFSMHGYYFISFKGLGASDSLSFKMLNLLSFGSFYDSGHSAFLCVVKN